MQISSEKLIQSNIALRDIAHRLTQKYQSSGKVPTDNKEMLVLLFLTKAQKTHAAIMLLCSDGYGQDAVVLSRSILELLITIKYILADSTDGRVDRYVSHDWVLRSELYENLKNREELAVIPTEKIQEIKANADAAQKKYGYKPYGGWSDKTMYYMAKEIGEESNFNICYGIQCSFSHSSARSMMEYMKESDGQYVFDAGKSERYINPALAMAFDFQKSLCLEADKLFSLGFTEELLQLVPPSIGTE